MTRTRNFADVIRAKLIADSSLAVAVVNELLEQMIEAVAAAELRGYERGLEEAVQVAKDFGDHDDCPCPACCTLGTDIAATIHALKPKPAKED